MLTGCQTSSTELIIKLAQPVLNRRAAAVEADGNAEREWCETIQGALRKTVLTKSCSSVRHPRRQPRRITANLVSSTSPTPTRAGTSFPILSALSGSGSGHGFLTWRIGPTPRRLDG